MKTINKKMQRRRWSKNNKDYNDNNDNNINNDNNNNNINNDNNNNEQKDDFAGAFEILSHFLAFHQHLSLKKS